MLETIKPEVFDGWFRYYQVAPWGREWHMMSVVAARISNSILASSMKETESKMFLEDDDLVPKWYKNGESPLDEEIEAQCEAADSLEGLGV